MELSAARKLLLEGLLLEIPKIIQLHFNDMFSAKDPVAVFYRKYEKQQQYGIQSSLTDLYHQLFADDWEYKAYLDALSKESSRWGENWVRNRIPVEVLLQGLYNLRLHTFERTLSIFRRCADIDTVHLLLTRLHEIQSLRYHFTMSGFMSGKEEEIHDLHQQKLNIMGQMSAGMAHEIRNPLTAFQGFLQLIREDLSKNKANPQLLLQYVEICLKEIQSLENLVTSFLILARKNEQAQKRVQRVELKEILQRVHDLSRHYVIEKDVNLTFDYDHTTFNVWAIPSHVEQICLNLVKNAVDAVEAGGEVTVVTRIADDRSEVMITFADNGCGIPQDRMKHLFEPFYTTKEKGTGIGLSVCKKLVEEMGGRIDVTSVEGSGTSVELCLHLAQES